MTFQAAVPLGGYAGWRFLNRTMEPQQAALEATPRIQRNTDYFAENIGKVRSAEALVSDRRLLSVALGAFGLDADIDNRFFIRKVLEDGATAEDALANRLSDKRYRELAAAFGFGDIGGPPTADPAFARGILADYHARQFEIAVGEQDDDMRLALNLERELPDIAARSLSEDGKWLTVMGSKPLRQVFETALGLPQSFGALDLDRQIGTFRDRAEQMLDVAEIGELAAPDKREELVRLFFARAQLQSGVGSASAASPALTILQGATAGGALTTL